MVFCRYFLFILRRFQGIYFALSVFLSLFFKQKAGNALAAIVLFVFSGLLFTFFPVQKVQAAGEGWFNTGGTWIYRRAISLSSATTVTNYQVKVTLTAANFDYTKLSFPATGDDLRFTGSDGTTSQDYWIESWVNGGTSTIWVEVASSGTSTIYMYYGNAGATAGSNGTNTFDLFDDFTGANGSSPDTATKWNLTQTGGGVTDIQNNMARVYTPLNGNAHIHSKTTFTLPIIAEFTAQWPGWGNDDAVAGFSGHNIWQGVSGHLTIGDYACCSGDASGWTVWTGYLVNTAYKFRWTITSTVLKTEESVNGKTDTHTVANSNSQINFGDNSPHTAHTVYFDDARVRKYAATEPTATLGAEEYFDHLAVTGTASMNAGASQVITITAKTNLNGTYTGYTGDKSLTFSGANISGGGNNPTCSNSSSADVNFGTATTVTFASGVATCSMKLYAAESISVDVTDGTVNSTGSTAYDLDVVVGAFSGMSIQINSNQAYTLSNTTTLTLAATGADQMKFSNNNSSYSAYEAYSTSKSWDITNATYGGTSSDGTKTVYVIFKDAYGNESTAVNDNIVYDTTPPTNPSAAVDAQGAVTDTWQNNKNDPNFTSFTGEGDSSGISNFYVYFGTDTAGVTTDSIVTDAYDPASFATSNIRYLRVITKDNAGNWADPDGGGTTCTNTNADRPADPDCWVTIFIHKYDKDAPNTPSPVAAPVSWTNINSFDFSWSNPGDTGGSGVKDYTYQTDAGTSATITSGTSVNGLTSNADGAKIFSILANDNAGNPSTTPGTVNFFYDGSAPTNAGTVTDGNGSLDNTWGTVSDPDFTWVTGIDPNSGVKDYDVYWGTDSNGTTVIATVVANAYNPTAIPVNTPYYLRIRTRDNLGNVSAWETKYTMKYSQAPSTPTGLSQTANSAVLSFGDWTTDNTPALNFTLSDPDSDTLGYVIKIDNNSDFSSPEVFYTYNANDLASGAEHSFTVGQGGGTYTNGSEGQTLSDGSYYWKVKAVENHGLASSEITANAGSVAFKVDANGPSGAVLGFGTVSTATISATVSGASDAFTGLAAQPYYFENTTLSTNSGWQSETSWSSIGLSINTQYTFKVTSKDNLGNTQAAATQNKYTLANIPSAPTVNNSTESSLDVNVNVNSNPSNTEYAIYKKGDSGCDGLGGAYIAANGSDNGPTAVWRTDAQWGTTTVTGLTYDTRYYFCVMARNGDNEQTSFGTAASGTTVNNRAPNAPALVSPADGAYTTDNTLTLSVNYSDPDTDNVGITNYRISSTNVSDCNNNLNVVASGVSGTTSTNNENTSWTPGSSIGSDGTYYWCAQNNDGVLNSSWTGMGSFILDTTAPGTPGNPSTTSPTTSMSQTWIWTAATDALSGIASYAWRVINSAGTAITSGTTTATSVVTSLTQGIYTFFVKANDNAGNTGAEVSGAVTVIGNTSFPTGSISINSGASYTGTTTVTLTLSASDDTDSASEMQMQISNNSDFSGASYESYETHKAWTLPTTDGVKTVYARFKDTEGNVSSTYSDTITLDTTAPNSFDLDSPGDNSYTNNERPTFRWKAASIGDATSGLSKYKLEIDNGDSGDFAIDGIPTNRTTDYETTKYLVYYEGFSDTDSSNNYISVYTKHSVDWGASENDGKLKAGKKQWKITAYDNAGNTRDASRTLYADYTNPSLSNTAILESDILGEKDGYTVLSTLRPIFTGSVSDNYSPGKAELAFFKQNYLLGIETGRTLFLRETFDLKNITNQTTLIFSISPSLSLDYGKYRVEVTGIDKAGNNSITDSFNLWVLSDDKAKQILTEGKTEEEKKKIADELRRKSQLSLPELEKKAILRREKEASEFGKIIQGFGDQMQSIASGVKQCFSQLAFAWIPAFAGMTNEVAGNVNNTIVNASTSLIVNPAKNLYSAVSDTRQTISNSVDTAISTTGKNLITMTGNAGNAYRGAAKTAPGIIGDAMLATGKTAGDFVAFNYRLGSNFVREQENMKEQIVKTQKEADKDLKNISENSGKFSVGVVLVGSRVISDGISGVNEELDKSQESIKKQIAKTHQGSSDLIRRSGQALDSTYQSIVRPVDANGSFFYRVGVGLDTFIAIVFDPTPTSISGVAIEEVGKDYAIVSWKTNHYAWGKVNYGRDLTYGKEVILTKREKLHTARLTGLKTGERYFFEVMSQNKNYAYDAYYSFETKK